METDGNLRTIQRNAPLPSLQLAQKRLPGSRLPCRQQRARKVLIDADLPQVQALRVGSAWLQLACLRTWRTPSSAVSESGRRLSLRLDPNLEAPGAAGRLLVSVSLFPVWSLFAASLIRV